ncbi:MAG: cation:proton antiporter [Leptospiraceae bacterium]|nr:cation:proton antiporter [Leptospiraceae bacterium]
MHHLIPEIGLGIIFAAVLAHVARLVRQPLLLGYIAGGILLGPNIGFGFIESEESIEIISEMGLVMLLFIIGLEIRLPELAGLGPRLFLLGVIQFAGCIGIGLAAFHFMGLGGDGPFDLLYLAIAGSLSSTLIVVKLLYDKLEIETAAGKLTIGILILQDLWAILFMGLQPSLANPEALIIAKSIGGAVLLVAVAALLSRFVLKYIFQVASRNPELVLVTAMAWCFGVCALAYQSGLSIEMGSLIAGVTIAAYPYANDVITKLAGIRDFFVTLFFVALGMKVPVPELATVAWALAFIAVVFLSRLLTIAPVAWLSGLGLRNGLVTALNLSQVSEFSLVIFALGMGYAHISSEVQAFVLTAMLLASLISTYAIRYNDTLARFISRLTALAGVRESSRSSEADPAEGAGHGHGRDIVVLGYYRIGRAFIDKLESYCPALINRTMVVDFNPEFRKRLEDHGFQWEYGDLANPDSLTHIGIQDARLILVTVSDVFLKGTTTRRLLSRLREINPLARHVLVADEPADYQLLKDLGAAHVLIPGQIAGTELFHWVAHQLEVPEIGQRDEAAHRQPAGI